MIKELKIFLDEIFKNVILIKNWVMEVDVLYFEIKNKVKIFIEGDIEILIIVISDFYDFVRQRLDIFVRKYFIY